MAETTFSVNPQGSSLTRWQWGCSSAEACKKSLSLSHFHSLDRKTKQFVAENDSKIHQKKRRETDQSSIDGSFLVKE